MEKNAIFNAASSFNKLQNTKIYSKYIHIVYSRNNLPEKVKEGAYMINLDEYADIGAHSIALIFSRNEIIYFDSFGVENVPGEIKKFIGNKNIIIKTIIIIAEIFRVQANNSVMCGYFWIGFMYFMLAGKNLTDFISLFSPYDF